MTAENILMAITANECRELTTTRAFQAMNEFAEQQAKEFAEWLDIEIAIKKNYFASIDEAYQKWLEEKGGQG